MKVLEELPYGFEFTCDGCGSRLAAEASDVKVGYFGPSWGGETPERHYYVTCVVCGTNRLLESDQLTPRVQELADRTDPHPR